MLKRFNLNTRSKRLALIARHADPYERRPETAPKALHIDASVPGEKVQMDCFYVGRLAGSKGVVWQYTAIDVASAYAWAFLRSEHRNPSARRTAELCHLVAAELKAAAGSSARSPQTTARSSAPSCSSTRSRQSAPPTAGSRPGARTQTAAPSASN